MLTDLARRLCGDVVAQDLREWLSRESSGQERGLRDLLYALAEFAANGGTLRGEDEEESRPRVVNYASVASQARLLERLRRELAERTQEERAAGLRESASR